MSNYRSEYLRTLDERGFLHQLTDADALDAALANTDQPVAAYIGFDCTASSLHAGSLVQIMLLRWLQQCGHRPIVLMGGGTTRIGDPSGKDEARQLLSEAQIEQNMAGIKAVFSRYLTFGDGPTDAVMLTAGPQLHRFSARVRTPLLDQSHAHHGFGEAAPGP